MRKAMRLPLMPLVAVAMAGLMGPLHAAPAVPPTDYSVSNGMVTLNLRDADIEALIATVSEATGKNFIVDPRVKARVNLISAKPMPPDELYNVFLSVLQVHGYAAVAKGEVIKIVPDVNAKQDGVEVGGVVTAKGADELVTEVVTLRHVQAAPLLTALRQLMPQQAALSVHPESNSLILTDRAGNVARMKDILIRVDQPGSDGIETIRLSHASATEIVKTLTQLHSRMGRTGGAPGAAPGAETAAIASFAADERSNSVLLSGAKTEREKLRAVVVYLDTPLERAGNTQVFYLKYARARELVPILQGSNRPVAREGSTTAASGLSSGFGSAPASSPGGAPVNAATVGIGGRQDAIVLADEATNALVITAPPNVMRELESIIGQLDIRRAQVLVEAIIAEVSDDFSRKLGVQMAAAGQDGAAPVGVVTFNGLLSAVAGAAAGGNAAMTGAALSTLGDGMNIGVGDFSGNTRFGVIVSALAGDANNNILSTPSLLTMDNQEASIVVGKNVPILTGSYASTGGGVTPTTPFQTVNREDIGVKLKVKPSISPEGAVRLELEQEVSSIDTSSQSSAGLITNKRNVKTVVLAQDGDIVVLGGLIDESVNDQASKVPLLGDIPLLGELFRHRSTTRGKRNLMIFIRPVVLRDRASANRYTAEKYDGFREQQVRFAQNPLGFAVPGEYPLLPRLDGYSINLPGGVATPPPATP